MSGVAVEAKGGGAPPPPQPYTDPQELWPPTALGVRRARHSLMRTLAAWRAERDVAEAACLVLAELAANAQRHGHVPGKQFGVSAHRLADGLLLEVHDAAGGSLPVLLDAPTPDLAAERGRGLLLVDAVTHGRWGVAPRVGAPGKVVWALVPAPASAPAPWGDSAVPGPAR
ncbi:ATP-binding protein [Streptomyces sp. NPDC003300]|uniref:ATP-binding protein n=1 Tax=unclassified Streptomyces TaxID=2593676 RepID=UPI0033A7E5BD